jgi:hypothetical protein
LATLLAHKAGKNAVDGTIRKPMNYLALSDATNTSAAAISSGVAPRYMGMADRRQLELPVVLPHERLLPGCLMSNVTPGIVIRNSFDDEAKRDLPRQRQKL